MQNCYQKNLSSEEQIILEEYLNSLQIIHTNDFICETAADLKKAYKLKLPDAITAATSFFLNIPLISFDDAFYRIDDLKILKFDAS